MVPIKHNTNTLLALGQGSDSLCDFTNKFTKIMNIVMDLDASITIATYERGLRPDSLLAESLTIHKLMTFTELFASAHLMVHDPL